MYHLVATIKYLMEKYDTAYPKIPKKSSVSPNRSPDVRKGPYVQHVRRSATAPAATPSSQSTIPRIIPRRVTQAGIATNIVMRATKAIVADVGSLTAGLAAFCSFF